jgi:hypothetical protein
MHKHQSYAADVPSPVAWRSSALGRRQRVNELSTLAKALAKNCRFHVFPCGAEKKMPCWGKWEGGKGFYDATTEPAEIDRLFVHRHAELIAVRTGEPSGVSILDIDVKHDAARAWWIKNESRLPATRTYRTRSGGLHLYYRHAPGVRNSEGVPVRGVDTRGEGGYVIFWYAQGFDCLDQSPPAPWPQWLSDFFWPPSPLKPARNHNPGESLSDCHLERIKTRAIDRVRDAVDGTRHARIRGAARLLGGIQERAGFSDDQAIGWLLDAAGLEAEKKARATAEWGLSKGRQSPLQMRGRA